ncbi:MAG: diguanylate cyclase [Chloroflexi bacterium]|nr:diguanylate cyclase [Chloroflexota bacterium]
MTDTLGLHPHALPRDALTQALTRESGELVLQAALQQASNAAPVSVLFLDIDHFKSINDAFGHETGDAALHFMVQSVKQVVGTRGHVVRYGGDEFLVILPQHDAKQAKNVAYELLSHFQRNPMTGSRPLHLRLSIGIAVAPSDGLQPEVLVRVADRRHYFAKHSGGHQAVADDRTATRSLISPPRRPVGQREQLSQLHHLMSELLQNPSGVIRIQSPPYGGAVSFLAHARAIAELQGYVVVSVQATPALHLRYLGALSSALEPILPPEAADIPLETPEDILHALRLITTQMPQNTGLLLTVANARWLDEASSELIQQLLNAPAEFQRVGLVYATVAGQHARFRAPMFNNISLPPLELHEVEAWLRHALRWEPPPACTEWVYNYTQGLPELILPTLKALVREGFLRPVFGDWVWHNPGEWEPLEPFTELDLPDVGVETNLPLLIGRNEMLRSLRRAVDRYPLISVIGGGGVGKTRMLQQLALESAETFTDGVRYVSLQDATVQTVPVVLAQALQLPPQPEINLTEQIIDYLKSRHMLLVLDGFEQVLGAANLVSTILHAAPQNRIVVGSRQRLHVPLEYLFQVDGLIREDRPLEEASAAVRLFYYTAQRNGVTLPEDSETRRTVAEICRWTDGSPLAIRIIAAWTTTLSPSEILARVSVSSPEPNPLSAVLEAFWELLSEDERQRLAQLSLFQGSFSLAAARFVAGASPFFLDALASKAYLTRSTSGRFNTHRLLRQFARGKLSAYPDLETETQRRHAEWYLSELPRQEGLTSEAARWSFSASNDDLPDVLSAWHWALDHREVGLLASSAPWVFHSLGDRNRFTEAHALLSHSLQTVRQYPLDIRDAVYFSLRAHLEIAHAEFHYHIGDLEKVGHLLERAHRRLMPFLPLLQQAYLLNVLARYHTAAGNYQQAEYFLQQAYSIYIHLDARPLLLHTINALGVLAYHRHDLKTAEYYFSQAVPLCREVDKSSMLAALYNNLANIAWQRGDLEKASRMLGEALTFLGDFDAPSLRAALLDSVGRVESERGNFREALKSLNEAFKYAHLAGSRPNVVEALVTTARAWIRMGRYKEAAHLLEALQSYPFLWENHRKEIESLQAMLPPVSITASWKEHDLDTLMLRVRNLNHLFIAEMARETATQSASSSGNGRHEEDDWRLTVSS